MKPFDARLFYNESIKQPLEEVFDLAAKNGLAIVVSLCDFSDEEGCSIHSSVNLPGADTTPVMLYAMHQIIQRGYDFAQDVLTLARIQDAMGQEEWPGERDNVH